MSITEVFLRITTALESAGIEYMLVGSFASTRYGSPRSTQDIDIVIRPAPARLKVFVEALKAENYYAELEDAASVVTVQGQAIDMTYLQKWISELGLREECELVRGIAGAA